MACILIINNCNLFVYNIVSCLAQIGADVIVRRNDDPRSMEPGWEDAFNGMLLSPGPGTPERARVCVEMTQRFSGRKPLFGVCLGLQAVVVALGGVAGRTNELLHGRVSPMTHDGKGVFTGPPSPLRTTHYHSPAAAEGKFPEGLEVMIRAESGVIMVVRYREWPTEAVQFRPESVLTEGGYQMFANWPATCGDTNAPTHASGFGPLVAADISL